MTPLEPYTFDLVRICFGDKPPWFLFEVALRTFVIFAYTLVLLRWMGKRGMGSLTPFEFAIIVALGSAVGDPMFYDDVPLVHTMLVIAIVVGMQRGLSWMTERNKTVERVIESTPRLLVRGGVIHMANLHREQLSHDELCEALRAEGVRQLGEVEFAYLEPSGKLSVLRYEQPRPGLPILPDGSNGGDVGHETPAGPRGDDPQCCATCGAARSSSGVCENCGEAEWTEVLAP
ncbi:DUF421 domain-containing protein [Botrimarina mediterranea]|uniref:YetF C-terminal domain-containing protein n=1 Tax=Botrimarina mediterranea TaxID=2528022 RepID=A0A518K4Y3_9BACT|nr:DUF421 domain-containing protein [Botrimarina mediterranea]QDV72851.1 hypothetical protein Spa11_10340 [Botrimarina mediterranea]QDV77423.1 hypothetical protein K2D_10150 [Planctomycetes bacterium K2D]